MSIVAVGAAGAPHPALLPHNMAPHLSAPHTAGRLGLASHPWPPLDPGLAPQLHSRHLVPGHPQTRRHSARREAQAWPPESLLVRQTGEETSTCVLGPGSKFPLSLWFPYLLGPTLPPSIIPTSQYELCTT